MHGDGAGNATASVNDRCYLGRTCARSTDCDDNDDDFPDAVEECGNGRDNDHGYVDNCG